MYYDNVKKYNLLRSLRKYLGDQLLEVNSKYNYKLLTSEQISNYWLYKIEQEVIENVDNTFEEEYLLEGLKEEIDTLKDNPERGMPFYNSKLMTRATNGWINGELYILAGLGGKGKTSFTLAKVIISCIINKEKLCVIANEEGIKRFRRNLLITVMGNLTKEGFARHRINEGKFSDEEYNKLQKAIDTVNELTEGNKKLITFVFLERYVITDVKKIIKHYAKLNCMKYLIDTGKPSEGKSGQERWRIMTEDMLELYKLCRHNAGGMGISLWINVQLADTATKNRFLNEFSLGEAKKMKNECSVLWLMRPVWDDELEGGKRELECYKWIKSDFEGKPVKQTFKLNRFLDTSEKYYLLFTAKNRLGQDNNTGLAQIVFKVNFNRNSWDELGYTIVIDDHNYS